MSVRARVPVLLLSALLLMALAAPPHATAAVTDFRSGVGFGVTGANPTTLTLFTVPAGMRFVLTEFELDDMHFPSTTASWSGYLISTSVASVVPGDGGASIQLGVLPNPSEGPASVRFELSARTSVVVAIFDVTGRRVRTLYTGDMLAGEHSLAWDGTDASGRRVSDGTYFARVESGETSKSRKITRVR